MNKVPKRVTLMRKAWAKGDAKRDKGNIEPASLTKVKDVLYKTCEDGFELKLDVYYPNKASEKLPVIFSIHGGGYFYGDKELYRFLCMSLAERGTCVVNIDYRLSPEYRFPDALNDINDALAWVGENIDKYYGDASKVMLIGDSAGAQLASHFGAIYSNSNFAALYGISVSKKIKIVALSLACGFYDLGNRVSVEGNNDIMSDYFGKDFDYSDPRIQVYANITSEYPPSYVFSGVGDFLATQAQPFSEFLCEKGVFSKWKVYEGNKGQDLGHVFHCDMKLDEASKCNDDQVAFLMEILER